MKDQFSRLACRRLELLEKIKLQRRELAAISSHLDQPFAVIDAGMKVVHFIYNHPASVAGVATALLTWRRKGIVGLARHAGRLLFIYPSLLTLGFKFLFSTHRSPGNESHPPVS